MLAITQQQLWYGSEWSTVEVSLRLMKPVTDEFGFQKVYVDKSSGMVEMQKLNYTAMVTTQKYRDNSKNIIANTR